MNKIAKISLYIIIFLTFGVGFFVFEVKSQAKAEQCYYPKMLIDQVDDVYENSVCNGNFQIYYFPVTADGRKYTITLQSIEGSQRLYASRYKKDVDELADILTWVCYDSHCDSATKINDNTKIVTFKAPIGEDFYYSWFAIYGESVGVSGKSKYRIGISNNGVMDFSNLTSATIASYINTNSNNNLDLNSLTQSVQWRAFLNSSTPLNLNDTTWTSLYYNDSLWQATVLPDKKWNCNNCYKRYRGIFNLTSMPNNLKAHIESDDGLWLYVNGKFIGQWGANQDNELLCVNAKKCSKMVNLPDIILDNLVIGENVISAIVFDGGYDEYFDWSFTY